MYLDSQFLAILESSNLSQHIQAPTHNKGHTLDLVITRNKDPPSPTEACYSCPNAQECDIRDIVIHQNLLSDHHSVFFKIQCPMSNTSKRKRWLRKFKSMEAEGFSRELK